MCLKLSSLDQTLSKLLLAYPDSSWRVSLSKWMQGNFPSLLTQLPLQMDARPYPNSSLLIQTPLDVFHSPNGCK
ncbi:hypothetical protein IGI04_007209, partial [Brassica rapa subsp. trilocularis]